MKISTKDIKKGIVKIRTESPEDLWHLQKVLEEGDIITAKTRRKASIKRGGEIEEGKREAVTLAIELEKCEYHKDFHNLRLLGEIVSENKNMQAGGHHTISIGVGSFLAVQKPQWKIHQLERLKKAGRRFSVLFCLIDRDGADFGLLSSSGLEALAGISPKRARKGFDEENREEFYKKIMDYLEQKKANTVVVAGPGFERENLLAYIREKNKILAEKIHTEHAHETGKNGMQEIIRKTGGRILKDSRVAEETQWVEKLLAEIAKDGLVVYGMDETAAAVNMGAVETLLVSENRLAECETIMETAEKMNGKVVIISAEHESGEKFLGIGGIGGLLRFRT
jgi:protein pelota